MRFRFLLRSKRYRIRILAFLIVVFAVMASASAILKSKKNNADAAEVFYPIKGIHTEEKIYALTANINGDEKEKDIDMLISVCEGMGLRITFFVEPDWIDENPNIAKKLQKVGTLGLYINKNLNGKSRNYIMEYIASCNDDFFETSAKYPKYVRVAGNPDSLTTRILNSYGQYCISYDAVLTQGGGGTIAKGRIIDIGPINEKTSFLLAQSVGEAITAGLTCIEMENFLYKIGSVTDEYGKQYA
ncbi:MAG TPA: hypothetical protein PLD48_04125 [Bacillota bacterium]|nr:hypothetical protein [Bacillota bacterium]HOK68689.1 hypothetical protein [Bacillota bacterium]HPP85365.1 hypothetical protein [Bacillota bacterium]